MSQIAVTPKFEARLKILNGSQKNSIFKILSSKINIGRSPDCHIQLTDPKCSRLHAMIEFLPEGIIITEFSDKGRMSVNQQVTSRAVLVNNTPIKMGDTELLFIIEDLNTKALQTSGSPNSLSSDVNPMSSGVQGQGPTEQKPKRNNKMMIYVVLILLFLAWVLFSDSGKSKKIDVKIKTLDEAKRNIEISEKLREELLKKSRLRGRKNPQYRQAQKFYLRGFRDFKNGNYDRSLDLFQTCVSLYSRHILCRRYSMLSQKKLDELRQYNMILGREYFEKNQFKQCIQAYRFVMTSIKDPNNGLYKEALSGKNICTEKLSEGF